MYNLSNYARPFSLGKTSGQDGNLAEASSGKKHFKDLILKANTVPLTKLFKHYNIQISEYSKKCTCPFPNHNSGQERTPSFWWYPNTNTFWCFGCKTGITCCDFVAAMDCSNRIKAAIKILKLFHNDIDAGNIVEQENIEVRTNILMKFSSNIRNFRKVYMDERSSIFIDDICKIFDKINEKYSLSNEALNSITEQLLFKIESYKENI